MRKVKQYTYVDRRELRMVSSAQLQRLEKEWWTSIRTVERMCDVKYIGDNPHTGVFVPWWAWEGYKQLISQSDQ